MTAFSDDKIDELVLALMGALEFENGRVWKRIDFTVMDRLHAKGYITDPAGRRASVFLTEDGLAKARALAARYLSSQ